jgi:hypothetical protein
LLALRCRFTGTIATVFLSVPLLVVAASPGQTASPAIAQTIPAHPANGVASEAEERTLRVQWRRLFDDRRWDELDSIAKRLRKRRLRFQGGSWQLHVLYTVLSTTGSKTATDAAWEAQIAALQEWMRHNPSSPTPRIALADAYENFAWKARGGGLADTVTPMGWKLFRQRIEKARVVLVQAEIISLNDPEWYDAMLVIANAQSWRGDQVGALVDKALSHEPGYYYVARDAAEFLLPKWNGSPGATQRFAWKVADKIGGAEGDATYFFIAENVLVIQACSCPGSHARGMSWPRIRKGYAAIERLYGTNDLELNAIASLAVRAGDSQTAQQAFTKIGNNWNKDVWGSKAIFDAERSVAYSPNLRPGSDFQPDQPPPNLQNLRPVPVAPSQGTSTAH